MNARLKTRDWEQLSAYLDGQLSERERNQLEGRLHRQPELSDALEELRHTRAILRAAPRRKVPHNFTLTHAMVAESRKSPLSGWFSVLSFSSALATVLLVVTAVLRSMSPATGTMVAMEAPAAMMETAREAASPEPTVPIIVWGFPGYGGGPVDGRGGGGGGGAPEIMAQPQEEMQDSLKAPSPEEDAAAGAVPEEGGADLLSPTPTPAIEIEAPAAEEPAAEEQADQPPAAEDLPLAPEATAEMGLQAVPEDLPTPTLAPTEAVVEPLQGSGPIIGIKPEEEQGKYVVPTAEPAAETVAGRIQVQGIHRQNWPVIQVALAVLAALSALGAVLLWRRARG